MRSNPILTLSLVLISAAAYAADTPAQTSEVCCDSCSSCDSCVCVATPCHPCGDLHPHYPYDAWPKTYYYFRPYNYRHVRQQQEQAAQWGASAGLPYSNEIFQSVYSRFESP